jgi:hypothetical protein
MTWKEVLKNSHEVVFVESYGYTEKSSFSSHFEPFKNKRTIKFGIVRGRTSLNSYLDHSWLFLAEDESELNFEERDGKLVLDDPDLWARP